LSPEIPNLLGSGFTPRAAPSFDILIYFDLMHSVSPCVRAQTRAAGLRIVCDENVIESNERYAVSLLTRGSLPAGRV